MSRVLPFGFALAIACSPTTPAPAPPPTVEDPSTWPTARGVATPPSWAQTTVPALPRALVEAAFQATEPALPAALADRHLVCVVDVATGRQSVDGLLDGAADIYTSWTLVERSFPALGGDDPGVVFVPVGAVAPGQTWAVRVEDIDAFGPDDLLATLTVPLVAGQPTTARAPNVDLACRAIDPQRLRVAVAPFLRVELPRAIARIDPRPDPEDQPEDERNRMIESLRYRISAAALVLGWDHPDVWPIVKLLDQAGPPTEDGRPLP